MERKKDRLALLIIIVTYAVGMVGFLIPFLYPYFLLLVPYHLLTVFGLLIWRHSSWDRPFGWYLVLTYAIAFSAEFVGVQTGWLFGQYAYGSVLGIKLGDTPLMIGINWILLSYCSYAFVARYVNHIVGRALFAATLMTLIDFFIEPVAIHLGFWSWKNQEIPLYNYVCWFVISFFLQLLTNFFNNKPAGMVAITILICQVTFFIFLGITLG